MLNEALKVCHPILIAKLLVIQLGVDGMKAGTMNHTMKWFMRVMPIIMLPLISNFPTVSWWLSDRQSAFFLLSLSIYFVDMD